ncbi:hypothetical protein ERO13_A02G152300v2 [Gossypium hirsutum]|uniref:Uncharacterized protein isoform X1 n=1 Tax=Gossypium hirsutum TaxID=3635 RepID=A0A1U8N4Y8_GOSHI|nr:uncharacterized protein LOC107943627 isoform X1 [Gossypium hirsutum]KAG4212237.1 hypothetical protein ERO13_A02G152300v2 [Gossypium hirsutum]
MDPRYTAEIFKHLEMQNELLLESYSSISHQLHKLQRSKLLQEQSACSESANAYLSSTVGIAFIFRFSDDTSRVSLSTIKEGIFKVEEEMLMRKFHELMKAQTVNKKNENNGNISTALVDPACVEGDEAGNSAPLVLVKSKEQL